MKKSKLSTYILAASIGSSAAAVTGVAFADGLALEEVVVTARKRDEFLQEVPVAITAVTAQTLENSGITDFKDITKATPGFTTVASASNETALALTLRGQVQNDVLITLDPSVGVYMDGLYIARAYGLSSDLLDVSSVQILKGPQGTLFGRNSTGGALLLQTADPELDLLTGSISLTGGGDIQGAQGMINVPLGDLFALRVAYKTSEREDYIRNIITGKEIGGQETSTGRVKLKFAPTDEFDFVLTYDKFDYDADRQARNVVWLDTGRVTATGGGVDLGRFGADDNKVANTFDPKSSADTETIYLVANYSAPFGELKLTTGHREVTTKVHFDLDGTRAGTHGTHGRGEMKQDSVELQLTSSLLDDKLELVVGGMYFTENAKASDYTSGTTGYGTVVPAIGFAASAVYYGEQDVDSIGVYSQATYALTDTQHITLGLRYSKDEKELVQRAGFSTAGPYDSLSAMGNLIRNGAPVLGGVAQCLNDSNAAALCQKDLDSADEAVSWTAGYDIKLTDDILLYTKLSNGYRSGGFNIRTSGGSEKPFEPEFTTEFEVGTKTDLFDKRLRWNSAIYINKTDDKQVSTIVSASGGQATTVVINAAETEVKGFETELAFQLIESITLNAAYAYTDAKYNEFKDGNGNKVTPTPRLWYIPENEYSLSLNYHDEFAFGNLTFNALYHWIDEMDSSDVSRYPAVPAAMDAAKTKEYIKATTTDAYGTLNLRLTYTTPNEMFNVSLWGNNVLDERAKISTLGLIASSYNYVSAMYNDPMTWGVTIGAKF
jgi:iron complex outermembrane receptor protein